MIPITEIENVLAKLDPKTRARVQSAQDIKIDKQLTPSIGLNFALRGGLGYGDKHLYGETSLLVSLRFACK